MPGPGAGAVSAAHDHPRLPCHNPGKADKSCLWGETWAPEGGASDERGFALGQRASVLRLRKRWVYLLRASLFCVCAAAQAAPAEPGGISEPQIVPRGAWGALPPNAGMMQEQKPAEIIIHHTAERQQPKLSLEVKLRGLQGFAMKPGKVGLLPKRAWGDVPYHYYIDVSGRIGEGRDPGFAGDGVTTFENDDRIQIAVEGDFEKEAPSRAEVESLTKLVVWLAAKYAVAPENISGHGDHDQTNCPGRNLKPVLEEVRNAVRAELYTGR